MFNVNRRGTEPFARWCERTAGVIPPPTRFRYFDNCRICIIFTNFWVFGFTRSPLSDFNGLLDALPLWD